MGNCCDACEEAEDPPLTPEANRWHQRPIVQQPVQQQPPAYRFRSKNPAPRAANNFQYVQYDYLAPRPSTQLNVKIPTVRTIAPSASVIASTSKNRKNPAPRSANNYKAVQYDYSALRPSTQPSERSAASSASVIASTSKSRKNPAPRAANNYKAVPYDYSSPRPSAQFNVTISSENSIESYRKWCDEDVIAQTTKLSLSTVQSVLKLIDEGCTVPFIARYRCDKTFNLPAENIRAVQIAYENVKAVKKKVKDIWKTLSEQNIKVDHHFCDILANATTLESVEYVYAPYDPAKMKSDVERSKELGLEPFVNDLLNGSVTSLYYDISLYVNPDIPGLTSETEIARSITFFISDTVSKDRVLLDYIRNHRQKKDAKISSRKSDAVQQQRKNPTEAENSKFEHYYNFSSTVRCMEAQAHQILALNRGEKQDVLTVQVSAPAEMKSDIVQKCWSLFCIHGIVYADSAGFVQSCFEEAYDMFLKPHIIKEIRTELTNLAICEALDIFCKNLRNLLLTPPIRGEVVLGIDPGFTHGCKLAVVSCTGVVLKTDVIFPHKNDTDKSKPLATTKFRKMVFDYEASLIALGNGTACRETEAWLSNLIRKGIFLPYVVKYCIVQENGASVYSVSDDATKDLPNMDPKLRSAVSIARRLQDPLVEYAKMDPKYLGIGMYQHDIPDNLLRRAANSVVTECVSLVGVDVNICSVVLLSKVSGLSMKTAKQIVHWRTKNGCFINRQQLLNEDIIKPKPFQQCAGFIKIFPGTTLISNSRFKGNYEPNPLDATVIHPESYDIAEKLLLTLDCFPGDIGTEYLRNKVIRYLQYTKLEHLAKKIQVSVETIKLMIDAFEKPLDYDVRKEFDEPLFWSGVKSIQDLEALAQSDQALTGRVSNVTHFGAFVDVGVGRDGLIHNSKLNKKRLELGDVVSVIVLSVDPSSKKISLKLAN